LSWDRPLLSLSGSREGFHSALPWKPRVSDKSVHPDIRGYTSLPARSSLQPKDQLLQRDCLPAAPSVCQSFSQTPPCRQGRQEGPAGLFLLKQEGRRFLLVSQLQDATRGLGTAGCQPRRHQGAPLRCQPYSQSIPLCKQLAASTHRASWCVWLSKLLKQKARGCSFQITTLRKL